MSTKMSTLRRRSQTQLNVIHQGDVDVKTGSKYISYYGVLSPTDIKLYSSDPNQSDTSAEIRMTISMELVKEVRKDESRRASNFPTIQLLSNEQFKQDDVRLRAKSAVEQEDWYKYLNAVKYRIFEGMLPGQRKDLEEKLGVQQANDYVPMSPVSTAAPNNPPPQPPSSPPPQLPSSPPPKLPGSSTTMPYYELGELPVKEETNAYEEPIQPNLPKWYSNLRMSRTEAENVLNSNQGPGNMMIRHREKDEDIWSLAVSIKEEEGLFRHYKVKKVGKQYKILLTREEHPELFSLKAVMEFFETRSGGLYKPLDLLDSQEYATYFTMKEPVLDDSNVYANDP